jgi:hypothetical protein
MLGLLEAAGSVSGTLKVSLMHTGLQEPLDGGQQADEAKSKWMREQRLGLAEYQAHELPVRLGLGMSCMVV